MTLQYGLIEIKPAKITETVINHFHIKHLPHKTLNWNMRGYRLLPTKISHFECLLCTTLYAFSALSPRSVKWWIGLLNQKLWMSS